MACNEKLADRVRDLMPDLENAEEKKMFRGLCFMVNNRMGKEELMCRIDPRN
jgi:hypothetical protein